MATTEREYCEVGAHTRPDMRATAVAEYQDFMGATKGLCGAHAFHVQEALGERNVRWYGTPDGSEPV
jgi:hypothetical protein